MTSKHSLLLCAALSAALALAACLELDDPARPPTIAGEPGALAAGEHAVMEETYNQAGCDVIGGSCGARGRCCDVHDDCIDQHCPFGFGDVRSCTAEAVERGDCPQACLACHRAVTGCILRCETFGGRDCGPSACCGDPADPDDDTCGEEQACYDRTRRPPELITDPCECGRRGIDLTPAPRRPEGHCCEDTGWGCCAGEGERPGPGGGACCEGLRLGADGCEPIPPTPTPAPTAPPATPAPTATPTPTATPAATPAPPTPTATPFAPASPAPTAY